MVRVKDENKRIAIYQAAMKVVNQMGLDHASMSKIAKEAKVSPATIYVYFENKEDMLNKLYLMAKERSSRFLFQGFHEKMDLQEALALYMKNLFHYMVENPVVFSFLEQTVNSPRLRPEVKEQGAAPYQILQDLYLQALEKGVVKKDPIVLLFAYVYDPILRLVKAHLSKELTVDNPLLEKAIQMTWNAVKA